MRKNSHITLMTSLGAALECYDFVVYGMLAVYLKDIFFRATDTWIGLIEAFCIFAVGYWARPFGGVVFGMFADRFGRRKVFTASMFVMGVSTFAMGLLPTYAQIGLGAPILMTILRMFQGLSFGAELPGAAVVITESIDNTKHHGRYWGLVVSSFSIGSVMATAVVGLLSTYLTQEEILTWGWRVPFIFGGCLAFISLYMRRSMQETKAFKAQEVIVSKTMIVKTLWQNHIPQVLQGVGLVMMASSMIITNLFFPSFLHKIYGFTLPQIYQAITWSLVGGIFMAPMAGAFVDRFGARHVLRFSAVTMIISIYPLFKLLALGDVGALLGFLLFYQLFIAMQMTTCFILLSQAFAVKVRYTAIALCYNLAFVGMSFLPILYSWLLMYAPSPSIVPFVLMGTAFITYLAGTVKR